MYRPTLYRLVNNNFYQHKNITEGLPPLPRYLYTSAMANPMTYAALQSHARRRARKILARCKCCTQADIHALYARCPSGHEVDHEIPLAIGGKHCLRNMRILTAAEHNAKTANDNRNIAALRRVWAAMGIDF